ncbi:AHL-dependent transcriptional regulator PpuR [Pseudomonas sp. StFLB209]|uniref:LuxR family transcriptional regulator n=1 Tax=Pseudomonas sp. StFLB209 TaxID=1028989 RepID=UPI0003C99CB4|nr:LuxR family transcriptional regulator [Pseudomonas sp. StFLB209]BAO10792.1 AHL-dependent transcriptional regulator PpuR [Pseudomonas sp. StFLB209]BAP40998.1 AHL-dependent transcriptional regulator PpuR [Pseudomonas sp. StFLB209]
MLAIDELIQICETERYENWLASLKTLTLKLGYSNFLVGLKPGVAAAGQQVLIHTDYPVAWRTQYDAQSYMAVDPIVHHCLGSNRPLIWKRENYRLPSESAFFEEATMYGLEQGLALPLHGPRGEAGMLCLKPDEKGAQAGVTMLQSLPMATMLRDYAIEWVLRAQAEHNAPVHLTAREKEVLQWSAAGKTTWEISMILSCTTSAIDFHFKNIRRKFQVSSRQMAVLRAIQQKLITP